MTRYNSIMRSARAKLELLPPPGIERPCALRSLTGRMRSSSGSRTSKRAPLRSRTSPAMCHWLISSCFVLACCAAGVQAREKRNFFASGFTYTLPGPDWEWMDERPLNKNPSLERTVFWCPARSGHRRGSHVAGASPSLSPPSVSRRGALKSHQGPRVRDRDCPSRFSRGYRATALWAFAAGCFSPRNSQ